MSSMCFNDGNTMIGETTLKHIFWCISKRVRLEIFCVEFHKPSGQNKTSTSSVIQLLGGQVYRMI